MLKYDKENPYNEYFDYIGEYSRYDHLAAHRSRVAVGQHVSANHAIARVGMKGYTLMPHLHCQVFVATTINVWSDFITA